MPASGAPTSRIMLVDGHSVAFRAFYAIPDTIRDAQDRPANAIYGFMNTLYRSLQDHAPSHAAVTFDIGAPFREEMFAGYKASRAMGPEDLEPQVEVIRTLLGAMAAPPGTYRLRVVAIGSDGRFGAAEEVVRALT